MNVGVWSLVGMIAGWYFTRSFIGGIIGAFVGSLFDSGSVQRNRGGGRNFTQKSQYDKDFPTVLLILTASMMKADGNPLKSELNFVKSFFVRQFGEEQSKKYIKGLQAELKRDIDPLRTTAYIQSAFSSSEKLQLIHYLAGIAYADGELAQSEYQLLVRMGTSMGLNKVTIDSIIAMLNPQRANWSNQGRNTHQYRPQNNPAQVDNAFKILGVEKSADENTIKKAYRKMVVKHHPDKVSHLGEEHVESAKVKFQKIQEAYEMVKTYKGIS